MGLSEHLDTQPTQLMAFWYTADGWNGQPQGPPDGGTDYNVIVNPEINDDTPYTLVVPGCTYYRECCLTGDYQLYVGWPTRRASMRIPADEVGRLLDHGTQDAALGADGAGEGADAGIRLVLLEDL